MSERAPDDPRFTPVRLRRELLAEGWHDRAIAAQVAGGSWVRVRHGAYVCAEAWGDLDDGGRHELITRAVLKQARTELVVSHSSGVPVWDGPSWGLDLSAVHTTRRDRRPGHDEAGVHQHIGKIAPGDETTRYGLPVMSPTRIALEVSTVASSEVALVVMNDFLHRKLTTPAAIRSRYDLGMDVWPDTLGTEMVIRLADPRIETVGETRFVYLCFRQGLPAPVPQYEVRDERGQLIAILDFAWPELGAFAEFDGKIKYQKLLKPGESASDVVVREKKREDLVREITGWRGLRVVWDDYSRPEYTGLRVRRLLYPVQRSAS